MQPHGPGRINGTVFSFSAQPRRKRERTVFRYALLLWTLSVVLSFLSHNVSKTGSVPVIRCKGGKVGPVREISITGPVNLSNWVGIFLSLGLDDGNRSSPRNIVFWRAQEDWQCPKKVSIFIVNTLLSEAFSLNSSETLVERWIYPLPWRGAYEATQCI
jgi:hypothetical protein